MAFVREQCQSGGLSEAALQLLTASWRDKTVCPMMNFSSNIGIADVRKSTEIPLGVLQQILQIFLQSYLRKAININY